MRYVVPLLLLLVGCDKPAPEPLSLAGPTMGTSYLVKLSALPDGVTMAVVRSEVALTLERVNQEMSGWIADSELARFNRDAASDWFPVSAETAKVVTEAGRISTLSGGAFDVTVSPLINLWGFGTTQRNQPEPEQQALEAARAHVGYHKLIVRTSPPAFKKLDPALTLNLAAIAKGYGVDAVAAALDGLGITDYLVEVGGEVYGKGQRPDGRPWQIGIERPTFSSRTVQRVVSLTGRAMATSGDYRNFRDIGGRRVSHTIDPRTGRPISHRLASVTVIAASCMEADGLATALMVLGPEAGLALADREGIAALLIVRDVDGFTEHESAAFTRELAAERGQ